MFKYDNPPSSELKISSVFSHTAQGHRMELEDETIRQLLNEECYTALQKAHSNAVENTRATGKPTSVRLALRSQRGECTACKWTYNIDKEPWLKTLESAASVRKTDGNASTVSGDFVDPTVLDVETMSCLDSMNSEGFLERVSYGKVIVDKGEGSREYCFLWKTSDDTWLLILKGDSSIVNGS